VINPKCPECGALQKKKDLEKDKCWKCKAENIVERINKQDDVEGIKLSVTNDNNSTNQNVNLTRIDMSFGHMIEFMVKWAIASIPAMIIVVVIIFFIIFFLISVLGLGSVFFR